MDATVFQESVDLIDDPELVEPVPQSFLSWIIESISGPFTLLLLLSGLACFVATLILVRRGNGPFTGAALILIVHIPLLIGVLAALFGVLNALRAIATSATAPRASDYAACVSALLVGLIAGIAMSAPSYAAAVIGAFRRSIHDEADQASRNRN